MTVVDSPATPIATCFHCAQPVFRSACFRLDDDLTASAQALVENADVPALCCIGCQTAANTILRNGLGDYYRQRADQTRSASPLHTLSPTLAPFSTANPNLVEDELSAYDLPETQAHFVNPTTQGLEAFFVIEGMRCGACLWLIEKHLQRIPGVRHATVNYANERLHLVWQASATRLSTILHSLDQLGYRTRPFDAQRRALGARHYSRQILKRLFIAALGMMQVMMYAYPAYIADGVSADGALDKSSNWLMQWASLMLTLPVIGFSAQPFFQSAWRELRQRHLGMDVPVVIGISAAFAGSLYNLWVGQGLAAVYFDSITMFIFLLLGARYLEWQMRQQAASELDKLQTLLPTRCERHTQDAHGQSIWESISATALRPGDRVRVAVGQSVPADGQIIAGSSEFNVAVLSGESIPILRQAGQTIAAGSLNLSQPIELCVTQPSQSSSLAQIAQAVQTAALGKPALAHLSDLIARRFTTFLLLFASICAGIWYLIDPSQALAIAILVLVVSCPCALALAAPTAQACALANLMRHGILVMRGNALEALAQANHLVVDKTGTLTSGELQIDYSQSAPDHTESALAIAYALEANSVHPIAQAFQRHAQFHPKLASANAAGTVTELQHVNIKTPNGENTAGMQARINGQLYRLGTAEFCMVTDTLARISTTSGEQQLHAQLQPHLHLYLARQIAPASATQGAHWESLASFALNDQLRPEAPVFIELAKRLGLETSLISGDRLPRVQQVAEQCHIQHIRAACHPLDKVAYVQQLQQQGERVVMIGDGVNDAPVLATATVSIALANGAPLTQLSADIVSQRPGLQALWHTFHLARATQRIMRQNLYWALLYNGCAIPAAALGWLSPWLASVGMASSSLLVVLNARRLLKLQTTPPAAVRSK